MGTEVMGFFESNADPACFTHGEQVVGHPSWAKRGQTAHIWKWERFLAGRSEPASDPSFATIGRWRKGEALDRSAPVFLPFLYFDIDHENVLRALRDVRSICEALSELTFNLNEHVLVAFSGKKGFHVQVSTAPMGYPVFTNVRRAQLFGRAFLEWFDDFTRNIDPSTAHPLQLIRMINAPHQETEFVKTAWRGANFLNLPLERILRIARRGRAIALPRDLPSPDPPSDGSVRSRFLRSVYQEARAERRRGGGAPRSQGVIARIRGGLAEGEVFGDKTFHVGRENGAYIFACWLIERHGEAEAERRLQAWNKRNRPPLPLPRLKVQFRGAKRTILQQHET